VSTQKQGLGVSLQAQKEAILEFASANGFTIDHWFEEKETAAKGGRPIFTDMLKQLRRGRADALIMHKIDRSARNMKDWSHVLDLPGFGVSIHFAGEGLDFTTRGGRLAANLQAVIAEDYIHNLREECIKGLRGRLKQGLYPFRAPIGYLDNGRGNPKTPCPKKAPLIRRLFDLYASGRHSIPSLQAEMKRLGLRNNANQPVSKHGIETILNNPFYTGLIYIKRTGESFDGVHEPIVSARAYQHVQDIKSGKAGKKITRHNHLYRGLFRCARCQRAMIPERQKAHVYYRCQKPDCPKNTIREDRLDASIQRVLNLHQITRPDARLLKTRWLEYLQDDGTAEMCRSIKLRIAQAEDRLQRLTDLLIDDAIDRTDHDARKKSLKLELAALREELDETQKTDLTEGNMQKFLELITSVAELHKIAEPDEKRCLVENCFSNRVVSPGGPCLKPDIWLASRDFAELTPLVNHIIPLLEEISRRHMR